MSNFITGKDLLQRWKIVSFELFEYVSAGKLQPLDPIGHLLPHLDYPSKADLKQLKSTLQMLEKSAPQSQNLLLDINDHKQPDWLDVLAVLSATMVVAGSEWTIRNHIRFKEALSRDHLGWKCCPMPQDKKEATRLLDLLTESLYRMDDVSKIEAERRQTRLIGEGSQLLGKGQRPSQIHKMKVRAIAAELWKQKPSITIADMIFRNETALACDNRTYTEKTLRQWIKDLCPNRFPGRRHKRK
jgi:hypothetical protein